MVERRIKPYRQQVDEARRRARLLLEFRRHQIFGLLLLAVLICLWTLLRTNPHWILPPGWWRL